MKCYWAKVLPFEKWDGIVKLVKIPEETLLFDLFIVSFLEAWYCCDRRSPVPIKCIRLKPRREHSSDLSELIGNDISEGWLEIMQRPGMLSGCAFK